LSVRENAAIDLSKRKAEIGEERRRRPVTTRAGEVKYRKSTNESYSAKHPKRRICMAKSLKLRRSYDEKAADGNSETILAILIVKLKKPAIFLF